MSSEVVAVVGVVLRGVRCPLIPVPFKTPRSTNFDFAETAGANATDLEIQTNLSDENHDEIAALRRSTLATGRAWGIKEMFRFFWQESDAVGGRAFFDSWYAWAIRNRLAPIRQVAGMLKTRLDRILTWFSSPISNGPAEGFNGRMQSIKS